MLLITWGLSGMAEDSNSTIFDSAEARCEGVELPGVRISSDSSGLDSFVGTNVIQTILYDPACDFDMDCFSLYVWDILGGVLSAGVGIVVAFLVLVLFLAFSPCLCSRRWRQWNGWKNLKEYSHPRDFRSRTGRVIVGVSILVGIATIATMIMISVNKVAMDNSLKVALCETLKFGNETINGGDAIIFEDNQGYIVEAQFPGFANAADTITNMTSLIEPNGTLVEKLTSFVNVSGEIEQELVYLQSILLNLNDLMKDNYLVNYHECVFCRNFSYYPTDVYPKNPLYPSMTSVNNSFAGLLVEVRSQLKPFVDSELALLYDTLVEMNSSINSTVDTVNDYVNDYVVANVDSIYTGWSYVDISIIVILCLTTIPLFLSIHVVRIGLFKSNIGDYTDPNRAPTNPKIALVSIYVVLTYTVVIFLASGILLVGAYIAASSCLVMEDMASAVSKLSFRFGSPDIAERVTAITQECLSNNSTGDILSAIVVDGDSTARDKINALTVLSGEFAVVQDAVDSGNNNTNLVSNRYLNNLSKYFASVGDLYLILPDTEAYLWTSGGAYSPSDSAAIFSTDYQQGTQVWTYAIESSPTCPDRSVLSANTPIGVESYVNKYSQNSAGTGHVIQGFSSMLDELSANGVETGIVGNCPGTDPSSNLEPWGNIATLKQAVLNKSDYRCDNPSVYEDAEGYFKRNATLAYCTASEYNIFISAYGSKFLAQAQEVDTVVADNWAYLFDELWSIIFDDLMEPSQELGETLNCQFASARWNAMRIAACNDFTPNMISVGKLLFALGFFGLFGLLVQILVWRHLKDNFCLWQDAVNGRHRAVSSFTPYRVVAMVSSMFKSARSKVHSSRTSAQAEHTVIPINDLNN